MEIIKDECLNDESLQSAINKNTKDFSGPSIEEFFGNNILEISPLELANLTYGTDKRAISKITGNEALGRSTVASAFMRHFNIKLKQ